MDGTVRLPQYQIGALQVLADDGRESVEAMLTRMLRELPRPQRRRQDQRRIPPERLFDGGQGPRRFRLMGLDAV